MTVHRFPAVPEKFKKGKKARADVAGTTAKPMPKTKNGTFPGLKAGGKPPK